MIVSEMAVAGHESEQAVAEKLLNWDYDSLTSTYFLLLTKKQAGRDFWLKEIKAISMVVQYIIFDMSVFFSFIYNSDFWITSFYPDRLFQFFG